MVRLTKRFVESRTPAAGDTFYWDEEVPGFGLRVKPSGRRSYIIQYRTKGRISRRYTIGPHGTYTAEKAREKARRLLQGVRDGRDPAREKEDAAGAPTVAKLAQRYLEEHAKAKKKPSSADSDEKNLNNHVLPELRQRPVAEVTRADIMKLRHKMRETPGAANRVLALLSKMFNLAEQWGWRSDGSNPCRHVERYPERKMERFLSAEEMRHLGDALAEAARTQSVSLPAVAAIRLLVFTGCRLGEILTLKWSYVDEAQKCLRLPDSKTGAKVIHLNAPALEVLAGMKRRNDDPWVIEGAIDKRALVNLRKPWHRIRRAAGLDDVRLHDLRHSFASVAVAGGLSLPVIGALLGHTQATTTQRYAHLAADPLKQATEMIGSRIAAAMAGQTAEVVQIAKRKRDRRG
jgi:integrase